MKDLGKTISGVCNLEFKVKHNSNAEIRRCEGPKQDNLGCL